MIIWITILALLIFIYRLNSYKKRYQIKQFIFIYSLILFGIFWANILHNTGNKEAQANLIDIATKESLTMFILALGLFYFTILIKEKWFHKNTFFTKYIFISLGILYVNIFKELDLILTKYPNSNIYALFDFAGVLGSTIAGAIAGSIFFIILFAIAKLIQNIMRKLDINTKGLLMTNKQSILIYATILILVSLMLFPPYIITNQNHIPIETGYTFLFSLSDITKGRFAANINISLLIIQITVLLISSGLLLFSIFKGQKNKNIPGSI